MKFIHIITTPTLGHRGYYSAEDRKEDINNLRAEGFNYFVTYRDTQAEFALQFLRVEASEGHWPQAADPRWFIVQ